MEIWYFFSLNYFKILIFQYLDNQVPTTSIGKLIGCFCCVFGILVLAMPVPVIVNNFQEICCLQQKKERAIKFKKKRLEQIEKLEEENEMLLTVKI